MSEHKKIREIKSTCKACGNTWYYGKEEIKEQQQAKMESAGKSLMCCGGCLPALLIPSKKVIDLDKCPKCGSRAIDKEEVVHEV